MENKKIKICWVTNIDKSLKYILLNYLKFLKENNFDVYAICSPGEFIDGIKKEGIEVKPIKIKRRITPFYDLITLFRLWNYFRKEKFDIVQTHTPKPSLLGQMAARLAGVPIIIDTVHGFYFKQDGSLASRAFFRFIRKISAKFSDVIFFVNREDMKTAKKEKICKEDRIRYFGGGIDLNRFDLKHFSDRYIFNKRTELGTNKDDKVIGIVARLVEEKGYLDLFEAFEKVIKKFPDCKLLIIGPEEKEKNDSIKINATNNIIFLGERKDVEYFYPVMDIFVLPSHREGLGISLIEASAMERPVVATYIRGCREAVDNGKTGILVPVKDSEKLAEAIIYLLENPEVACEMGRQGRQKVEREFDEKLVFDRIKECYRNLIREKIKGFN